MSLDKGSVDKGSVESGSVQAEHAITGWPGEQLREARARLGLSPEQVERQLFFQPGYVQAIESGDFSRLPRALFIKGYLRAYAKLLHLSPTIWLQYYQSCFGETSQSTAAPVNTFEAKKTVWQSKPVVKKSRLRPLIIVGLMVILLLGLSWWPQLAPALNRWLGTSLPTHTVINPIRPDAQLPAANAEKIEQAPSEPVQTLSELPAAPVPEVVPIQPVISLPAPAESIPTQDVSKDFSTGHSEDDEGVPVDSLSNSAQTAGAEDEGAGSVAFQVLPDGRWQIGEHEEAGVKDHLQITLGKSTWVQIIDAAGLQQARKTHRKGAVIKFEGEAPFTLSMGDIKGVRLVFNNREVSL